MIIDDKVLIRISPSNFSYYKSLGYNFNSCGAEILVNIFDLLKGSKVKINCKCFYCEKIKIVSYKNYNKQITKGNCQYTCIDCLKNKIEESFIKKYGVKCNKHIGEVENRRKNTILCKYGVENIGSSNFIRNKIEESLIKKYGVNNPFKSKDVINKIKNKNIESGKWVDNMKSFNSYRRRVKTLTNKIKSTLYKNWDGYDYYDGEYIKEYLNLDKNNKLYPTIDHKISTLYGFLNKITVEDICLIENLCITKRYLNSQKSNKTEDEYNKFNSIL